MGGGAPQTLYYLGPAGTFTHQATDLVDEAVSPEPLGSVAEVVQTVEDDPDALGLVPIENSVEGVVTSTVDEILFRTASVMVRGEVVVPVSFTGFTLAGAEDITTAISHPHALAQCKGFIAEHGLRVETATSTSKACEVIAAEGRTDAVALSAPKAGDLYGLEGRYLNIEDNAEAHTRFYLLAGKLRSRQDERAYESWLAVLPPSNRTGVLAEMLGSFAERSVGINAISSRPLRAQLGAYCFLLNVQGWFKDPAVEHSIGDMIRIGCKVRILGSFPKWRGDGVVPTRLSLGGILPEESPAFSNTIDDVTVDP